jgi:Tfp pilus assembly PilM family ATPase
MVRSIGIDPGDRVVNVVELDGSYRKTRLLNASSEDLGSVEDPMRVDIIAEAVRGALDSGMKGDLTLGHPCREAVLRTIELPFKGAAAIRRVVKSEIEAEIFTHSVDDMVVDFHELGEMPNGGTKLLVASIPKISLRSQLHSMSMQSIDPEFVDLDTMALWRVADWAGAFEAGEDSDDAVKPVHAVVDISSRSVKVLLTEGGQLVEMRVLRFGDSVASELVARAHNLDPEQARLTIDECLRTGTDAHVESVVTVPALPKDLVASDETGVDADVIGAAEEADGTTTRSELVTYSEVDAANTKYLQRLARELTRFLAASGMAARVRSIWTSGSASRGSGVVEVLESVFGYPPQELDVLSRMSHSFDQDEASQRSPGMAIAVGLALGRMGGPEGFNLRQEDLAQTGGFDRIKFPLAIACMVSLLVMFVFANQKMMKLKVLELEIGQSHHDPKQPNASRFHGQLNALFRGKWFQDKSYFGVTKGKSTIYSYKDLMEELKRTPVANRVRLIRDKLRIVAAQKQKASGVYEDVALESGLAVLVRWSEVLKGIEPELGRYLVAAVDLDMKTRKLTFSMALRGDDFRARQSGIERAFQLEIEKPDSPFQRPEVAGQESQFAGTATPFTDYKDRQVAGAHIVFVLDIKESFQPFGPSTRVGALLDNSKLPPGDYLAMNHTPAVRNEEEAR